MTLDAEWCYCENPRWEYYGMQQGEEWERCMNCGEVRIARYHDTGSGG